MSEKPTYYTDFFVEGKYGDQIKGVPILFEKERVSIYPSEDITFETAIHWDNFYRSRPGATPGMRIVIACPYTPERPSSPTDWQGLWQSHLEALVAEAKGAREAEIEAE